MAGPDGGISGYPFREGLLLLLRILQKEGLSDPFRMRLTIPGGPQAACLQGSGLLMKLWPGVPGSGNRSKGT